jgi:hypothetical protein
VNVSSTDLKSSAARGTQLIRVLLLIDFALLLALIGPGNNRQLYLAERRMGIANIVTHTLQFWFIGSTVVVTALFVRMLVSRPKALHTSSLKKLDWVLFLSWWFVVAICCMFAFMVGLGG